MSRERLHKVFLNISLVFVSVVSFTISLEVVLRLAGFWYQLPQIIENSKKIDANGKKIYRILLIGESTSFYPVTIWPKILKEELGKSDKYSFKIIDKSIPGTNTSFIASRIEGYINDFNPDIVVSMMGVNDNISFVKYEESNMAKVWNGLRIVKVYKFLVMSTKKNVDQKQISNDAETVRKGFDLTEEGSNYFMLKKYDLALKKFNESLVIDPYNQKAYLAMGYMFWQQSKLTDAENMYKKAIEISQLTKGVRPDESDSAVTGLLSLYKDMGYDTEKIEANLKEIMQIRGEYLGLKLVADGQVYTKYHYKKVYAILKSRGIKLIATQYPTLKVDELKNLLDYPSDVTFVSNEENFAIALKTHKYSDLFTDKLRETFGHTTKLGDELIAKNVADAILKTVESR